MDLGISSLQLEGAGRGFSYSSEAPLDMRMDPDQSLSAAEVVNEWPEKRLREIIRTYGEERHARLIARAIAARRPLASTGEAGEGMIGWAASRSNRPHVTGRVGEV